MEPHARARRPASPWTAPARWPSSTASAQPAAASSPACSARRSRPQRDHARSPSSSAPTWRGKIDADGGTTCIYWATGPGGSEIEEVGDLTAEQAERHDFGPPKEFGTGTQLLPAVRYFVDRFKDAPWGFYVFITDGELHDLDAVKEYSTQLARDVAAKRRRPLKFVLIGVGPNINEGQMEELDDLDTGTDVDLWDHKIASEMRVLAGNLRRGGGQERPHRRQGPHPRSPGTGRQGLLRHRHVGLPGVRGPRRRGLLHARGQRQPHPSGAVRQRRACRPRNWRRDRSFTGRPSTPTSSCSGKQPPLWGLSFASGVSPAGPPASNAQQDQTQSRQGQGSRFGQGLDGDCHLPADGSGGGRPGSCRATRSCPRSR